MEPHDLTAGAPPEGEAGRSVEDSHASIERNGDISVIRYPTRRRVLDVKIREGVQTVRIDLG